MSKRYLLIFCLLFSACSNAQKYQPVLPCRWESPVTGAMQPTPPDCFRWWERLCDPVLNSLMCQAAKGNNDLKMARRAGRYELKTAWVNLSAEVATNYIKFRALQHRLSVIDKNIAAQQETLNLTKDLITGGFVGSIDQAQAEEQLNQLSAQRPLLQQALEQAYRRLTTLAGCLPGSLSSLLCASAPLPTLPNPLPIGCPFDLLRRRADIQSASTRMPSRLACANYKKTLLEALEEAENGIAGMRYSSERSASLAKAYEQSREAYQLMYDLYQRGMKDYLELLVIQRSLLATEDEYLQAQVDVLTSYIALYKALGGSC